MTARSRRAPACVLAPCFLVLSMGAFLAFPIAADDRADPGPGAETSDGEAVDVAVTEAPTAEAGADVLPVYVPPSRGDSRSRVGAATRGGAGPVAPVLLAPRHVGLTRSAQPELFWYLDREVEGQLELVLSAESSDEPLIDVQIPSPVPAGVHALSLEQHGATLEPGVVYQWVGTLVVDPNRPWKDRVAYAAIERVDLEAGLAAGLPGAGEARPYLAYARAGLWFDAVQDLSQRIDAEPRDGDLREARAALLDQVGLREPARSDRSATR